MNSSIRSPGIEQVGTTPVVAISERKAGSLGHEAADYHAQILTKYVRYPRTREEPVAADGNQDPADGRSDAPSSVVVDDGDLITATHAPARAREIQGSVLWQRAESSDAQLEPAVLVHPQQQLPADAEAACEETDAGTQDLETAVHI